MQLPRLHLLTCRTWLWPLLLATATAGSAQELRPGVWAANDASALPLPLSGYQVYLIGEMHGVKENAAFFGPYLSKLNRAGGLRDVAIEEKPVYECDAQAYVEGRSSSMPTELCLRANIIDIVRQLNQHDYQGPLTVEWEDALMDREAGAKEACGFVRKLDFPRSNVAFDAAFSE